MTSQHNSTNPPVPVGGWRANGLQRGPAIQGGSSDACHRHHVAGCAVHRNLPHAANSTN